MIRLATVLLVAAAAIGAGAVVVPERHPALARVVYRPAPPPPAAAPAAAGVPGPVGRGGGWVLAFHDEFEGDRLGAAWSDASSAEADGGHGNLGNRQLEWNQAANCQVGGGQLTMVARRQAVTSPSGTRYGWTSCLLTSAGFALRYGYLEERAILPWQAGFWPAFWTWQVAGTDRQVETDVYELHTTDPRGLLLTQHSGDGGGCAWRLPFDPGTGWHVYGVEIAAAGTTWFVDGAPVCRTAATSDGDTNLIANLAVDGRDPPAAATTTAAARIDYIRAWRPR